MAEGSYNGRGTVHKPAINLTPYVPNSATLRGAGPNTRSLSALTAYAHFLRGTVGNADQSSASHAIFQPVDKSDIVQLRFYMVMSDGSSPDNKTGTARVWMAKRVVNPTNPGAVEYVGRLICSLALTCGATAIALGSGVFPPGARLVDTIVKSDDATPDGVAPSNSVDVAADLFARLRWDKESDEFLIVEVSGDNGTPSSRVGVILEHV